MPQPPLLPAAAWESTVSTLSHQGAGSAITCFPTSWTHPSVGQPIPGELSGCLHTKLTALWTTGNSGEGL